MTITIKGLVYRVDLKPKMVNWDGYPDNINMIHDDTIFKTWNNWVFENYPETKFRFIVDYGDKSSLYFPDFDYHYSNSNRVPKKITYFFEDEDVALHFKLRWG